MSRYSRIKNDSGKSAENNFVTVLENGVRIAPTGCAIEYGRKGMLFWRMDA